MMNVLQLKFELRKRNILFNGDSSRDVLESLLERAMKDEILLKTMKQPEVITIDDDDDDDEVMEVDNNLNKSICANPNPPPPSFDLRTCMLTEQQRQARAILKSKTPVRFRLGFKSIHERLGDKTEESATTTYPTQEFMPFTRRKKRGKQSRTLNHDPTKFDVDLLEKRANRFIDVPCLKHRVRRFDEEVAPPLVNIRHAKRKNARFDRFKPDEDDDDDDDDQDVDEEEKEEEEY